MPIRRSLAVGAASVMHNGGSPQATHAVAQARERVCEPRRIAQTDAGCIALSTNYARPVRHMLRLSPSVGAVSTGISLAQSRSGSDIAGHRAR
jgi:hypothetical protein